MMNWVDSHYCSQNRQSVLSRKMDLAGLVDWRSNGIGRVHTTLFKSSDDSSSDEGNFPIVLLENGDKDAFFIMGLTGDIETEEWEPTT